MGKADVNVNIWLSEKKRFANLFNGVIYGGRQVILPEDLEEVNPVSSVSVKNRTENKKHEKIPRYHYEMAKSGYTCVTCK